MTCNCSAQSGGKKLRRKHKGGFLGLEKLFDLTNQSQSSSSGYYTPGEVSGQPSFSGYNQPSTNYMSKLTENIRNVGQTVKNKLATTYSKVSGSSTASGLSSTNYMSGGRKTHRKNHKGRKTSHGGKKSRKNKSTRKHRKYRKH